MPSEPLATGYYGKVPSHDDFVSSGLPRSFIQPWDAWLQEAISSSRQQLGESWLNYYLTSPIYRFVLSPGICGENAWLGVLMPSVDRIGRYYPMTLSLGNDLQTNPFSVLQQKNGWFTQLEDLALFCLEDDFSLEVFNRRLSELPPHNLPNSSNTETAEPLIEKPTLSNAWRRSLDSIESIPNLLPVFLDNLLKEHCFAYSIWWTQGSEQVSPSLLICEGLPPYAGMAAMFDGNWQQWGWDGNHYPILPVSPQEEASEHE